MPDSRNKNLKYQRIPLKEIKRLVQFFYKSFILFLELKGFPENIEYNISFFSLADVIIRVDKRKTYYQCFHDMEINECKEVALYAYWILKLRPFTITDVAYRNNSDANFINESSVIFLIGFILEATGRIKQTATLKDSYSKFIEYSFRYRNFTIDSFVVLIESIGADTFEREYPNLYNQP